MGNDTWVSENPFDACGGVWRSDEGYVSNVLFTLKAFAGFPAVGQMQKPVASKILAAGLIALVLVVLVLGVL